MGLPFYLPCNAPAVRIVGWRDRGEKDLRMCFGCADHNTRNRGATDLGPYVPLADQEIPA